jgi:hypothetical protein
MNGVLRANEGGWKFGLALVAALLFFAALVSPSRADYLSNTDLKDGFAFWHGDGDPAFLNPDGAEGAEGDEHVVPVIKIKLSKGEASEVDQTYETKDDPKRFHLHVEVYASEDFKRSTFTDDYSADINWDSTGDYHGTDQEVPNADFWIHDEPNGFYHLASLKPGEWVSIDCTINATTPVDERTIYFSVPPGDGAVYMRNASVTAEVDGDN